MFGQDKKKRKAIKIETLVGRQTELRGDIHFSGGIHVDGTIKGNLVADSDASSVLSLSKEGVIEGEVRVPHITLNGTVLGDVYASHSIELASEARVKGNVYYNLIEMAMGAEVNGKLVHQSEAERNERKVTPVAVASTSDKKVSDKKVGDAKLVEQA